MSDTLPTRTPASAGKEYWRSMDELEDTPEFRRHLEREFPSAVERITDAVSRRHFIGLMGAAIALSGVVGCRRPLARILPYTKLPEDLLPGVPQQYATVMPFRGVGEGLLVTSNEGRPTKIEGNPSHPSSLGATHVWAQAATLELYDPERAKTPRRKGNDATWDQFTGWALPRMKELRADGGKGLRILAEASASPALAAMRDEFLAAYPQAEWQVYEPLNRDNALEGSRIAFGKPLRTQLLLDQADVIVSLDSDFLYTEPNSVRVARDYASRRRTASEKDRLSRHYQIESAFSVTGTMADHRLRATHARVGVLGRALAAELAGLGADLRGYSAGTPSGLSAPEARFVKAVAKDLAARPGRAVVLVGGGQPAELHALGHVLNRALGAVGPVVRYTVEPEPEGQTAGLGRLAADMKAGRVDTLFVLGGNPAYNAPADLDFAGALGKVPHVVRLGLYHDETGDGAEWELPKAHFLESWGDNLAWDGTLAVQQPLIAPLYEGKSEIELLALVLDRANQDGHDILQELYAARWGALGVSDKWRKTLSDGLVEGSAYPEIPATPDGGAAARAGAARKADPEGLEIVFRADHCVWDGRWANSGWLQELPDNLTKMVWDNAALVSPATARELGVKTGDVIRIGASDRSLEIAVWIAPGHADRTLTLPLGYGRTKAGRIGGMKGDADKPSPGFDTYALRTAGAMDAVGGVTVENTGGRYELVSTQTHFSMEDRRLVREASLAEYRKEPDFARDEEESAEEPLHRDPNTLFIDRTYDFTKGHQWGMSIDLSTCIGCNACTVACQSENNVAIVGKDEVRRGREMHWIRLDRYYVGAEEDPRAVQQPLPCMQCENAPCESVCPVQATSHSDEGLNDMVYNRCIGTRYCNNNCPYKVRRFNYFDWNKGMTEVEKMEKNPDVTVRMRGVMEKCTYCVQRINRAKIHAKIEGRPVADGEIVTACQQVCPTRSIVFGDVNDPGTRVTALKSQNKDYVIFGDLDTRPRTSYLARIRNPNPELEQA